MALGRVINVRVDATFEDVLEVLGLGMRLVQKTRQVNV